MAVNRFVLNGVSYHGHGAIGEIPGIIKAKGLKKAFVASDPDLVKFGVTSKVTDLLEKIIFRMPCIRTSSRIRRLKMYRTASKHTENPAQTS